MRQRRPDLSRSGPWRHWVKTQCPNRKRENAERHRLFEQPSKPNISERERALQRKREELARVEDAQGKGYAPALISECAQKTRVFVNRPAPPGPIHRHQRLTSSKKNSGIWVQVARGVGQRLQLT